MKKTVRITVIMVVVLSALLANSLAIAQEGSPNAIAEVDIQSSSIQWTPLLNDIKGMTLTIAGPDNFYFQGQYNGNDHPGFLSTDFVDGSYHYEIVLWPNVSQGPVVNQSLRGLNSENQNEMKQSGAFTVLEGAFVIAAEESIQISSNSLEGEVGALDIVQADDLIVQGSICSGFDCVENESFGFDVLRLKENNTRIGFNDTSVDSFPSNDWAIVANDSASGGANFLGFEDVTGAKFPFKITAGAPTDSLFVSSSGNMGLGTGVPALDIHINTVDTPALRLEQNGSGGFTAQTWDIAGNEANFFIRDLTSGSRLPFRIRPGAPTSSIDIAPNGNVGIGTSSPASDLDVANTGETAVMTLRQTDGAILRFVANSAQANIGTTTNSPLVFRTNNTTRMTLNTSGGLIVQGPVSATVFNTTSDRYAKENFVLVDQQTVLERLSTVPISTWNFIENDNKTKHMGPTAQDFYAAFGLGTDDKHISMVDADGVAFAAIQELDKQNRALSSENASLRVKVEDLAARVFALESGTDQPAQNGLITLLAVLNLGLILIMLWAVQRGSFSVIKPRIQ